MLPSFTYCESLTWIPEWGAQIGLAETGLQPLNLLSNLIFWWVAWRIYRHLKRSTSHRLRPLSLGGALSDSSLRRNDDTLISGTTRHALGLIIAISLVMGINSTLWHWTMEIWALGLDVTAIALGISILLWHYLRARWALRPVTCTALIIGFLLASAGARTLGPEQAWLMSGAFFPAILGLVIFAGLEPMTTRTAPDEARRQAFIDMVFLLFGALCLGVGILFRIQDLPWCQSFAWGTFGTHFLWHIGAGLAYACFARVVSRLITPKPHHD